MAIFIYAEKSNNILAIGGSAKAVTKKKDSHTNFELHF